MENKNQITEAALRQIIKEEAIRFKKKLAFQAEKAKLMESLQLLETEQLMEDLMEELDGVDPNAQAVADKVVNSLPEPTKDALANELDKFAGMDPAQIKAIADKAVQATDATGAEGMMNEAGPADEKTVRQKIWTVVKNMGIGGAIAGIITTGVVWLLKTEHPGIMSDITATTAALGGMITTVISGIVASVAQNRTGELDTKEYSPEEKAKMDAIIRARKAKFGR